MYSLKQVIGVNFGAFPRFRLEFKKGEALMIYGLNEDDEGSNSNGCGKSTLLNTPAILLLDVFDKDLTKVDYILDGKESSLISGELYNPILNKTIRIRRKFYKKRSAVVEIWENGKYNEQITSVREGNARILELLDLSKEDILNYYIIGQGLKSSFFGSTDNVKKKIISRFSNVDSVDAAIENCKNKQDSISADKISAEKKIVALEAKIEANDDSIAYEKDGRKTEKSNKLKELKTKIATRRTKLDESIVAVEKARKKLKKFQKKNDLEDLKDYSDETAELNKKIKLKSKKKQEKSNELSELKIELRTANSNLKEKIVCPKCEHEWILEVEESISDIEKIISDGEKQQKKLEKAIKGFKEEIESLETKLEDIEDEEERIDELKSEFKELKEAIEEKVKQSERAKELLENAKKDKEEYEEFKVDKKRILQLEKENEDYTAEIEDYQTEIDDLDDKYAEYAYWRVNFASFKTYLINKVIKTLEGYVNYQLNRFKTYLTVKIEGFTTNQDGTTNEKINVLVSKDDGESWQKYARYSGGQKSRLNICSIIAIQKLINLTSKVGGVDFLGLDETFDTLDTIGQIEIVKMLENSGITTAIISHNNEDIGAANEVWIKHRNRLSRIMSEKEVKEMKEEKIHALI